MDEKKLVLEALQERLVGRVNKEQVLVVAQEAMSNLGMLDALFLLLYKARNPLAWRIAI